MPLSVAGDDAELSRLAELDAYEIMDTAAEATFDALAAAAAAVAGVGSAGIGLIDGTREWFKAGVNLPVDEMPREQTFCRHVVADGARVVVADTRRDPRFAEHAMVTPDDGLRFYAGFPLSTPSGAVVGSLCVMGPEPRILDAGQVQVLQTLADQAMTLLELRRTVAALRQAGEQELARTALLEAVLESVDVGVIACDAGGEIVAENEYNTELVGLSFEEIRSLPPAERARRVPMTTLDGTPIASADRPLSRVLRGELIEPTDVVITLPGRRPRYLRAAGRSMRSPAGDRLGSMVVLHDVTDAHEHATYLSAQMRDVERLADFSRKILSGQDAASTACEAVLALCSAQQVSVLVPGADGTLAICATTEPSLEGFTVQIDPASYVGRAFTERRPVFVDPQDRSSFSAAVHLVEARHGPIRGALYFPLLHEQECCGVLSVTTATLIEDIPDRVLGLLEILTAELSTSLDRDRLRRQLTDQASTDPLTGLANRRSWDRHLAAHLTDTRPICLAVLDLDHFKAYNDTYGHPAGDALLAAASSRWAGGVRGGDVLARLGGEEFGVLLPGCSLADATRVVESLRSSVPDAQTVSAGLAELRPGESAQDWFERADRALYVAKNAGRDRLSASGDGAAELPSQVVPPRTALAESR